MRPRVHLGRCEHCGRKIAWSRKRRQWLALAPRTELRGKPIHRRMDCSATGSFHDPKPALFAWARPLLAGEDR